MGHYDKLARDIRELRREVRSGSQANQAAHTSIEDGAIHSYDRDGNLRLRIGAQDDGTQAVQFVQGPPPPRPTAPVVSVDGPVVRVRWDGELMGGHIPEDFARIDVHFALAADDLEDQGAVKGNLATVAGNETVLAATQTGTYRVGLVAVSQSRARSEMSDTATVDVTLVGMGDAIEAVADSANGKNTVTFSSEAPTPADEGIAGDTWFVGEVGRPDDIIEATNLALNPSFENGVDGWTWTSGTTFVSDATHAERMVGTVGSRNGRLTVGSGYTTPYASARIGEIETIPIEPGKWVAVRAWVATENTGEQVRVQVRVGAPGEGFAYVASSFSAAGFYTGRTIVVSFQMPADKTAIRPEIQLYSGSSSTNIASGKRMWIDGVNIVTADSEETARSIVGHYFDGDTPDGGSENESHYRWTGEPHASTSEKYLPALDIGDDDKWNVTEQYQHTGSEWVRIELSHRVFSTVDLAKATVGYLNGQRIEAGSIETLQLGFGAATGDVLSADAVNGKTIRGVDIYGSTFRAGDAVEITEEYGIRQYGPDGAINIDLPSNGDPATFRGDLSARTFTATGSMSIQGPGAIAAGGVLELESGVVPPVAVPQLTNIWDRITMPPLESNETVLGLAWGQDHWWRAVDVVGATEGDRIEKITPTGELVSSFSIDFFPLNGLTMIGDDLILLGIDETGGVQRDNKKRFVRVYGTDGTRKHQWQYTQYGTGTYQPGIGKNGQRLIIAQCWATGELTYRQYSPSTGTLYVTDDTGDNFRSDVAGFLYGSFDLGTDVRRAVVGKKKAGAVRQFVVLNSLTYQYEPEKSWHSGEFRSPVAIEWDGSHFFSMESDGNLTRYQPVESGKFVGDDEDDWWGAVAWASTDGTQVTPVGPATRFRYLHRSIIRRQNGDVPEGVERARFYVAKKATTPGREDLRYVTYSDNPTTWSRVRSIPDNWITFPLPVTTNSFVTDKPGELRSTLGTFRVDGTGAGQWGPLTFHADGSMTSNAVPAWTPLTTFKPGFAPATSGFVPAYRVWPDGKVEWRGVIAGSVSKSMGIVTIPVGARPPHAVNVPAATGIAGTADGLVRVEFGAVDRPTEISVYPEGKAITWVSLYGLYYYLA